VLVEQNVAVSLKLASRAYVLENGRVTLSGHRRGIAGRRPGPAGLSRDVSFEGPAAPARRRPVRASGASGNARRSSCIATSRGQTRPACGRADVDQVAGIAMSAALLPGEAAVSLAGICIGAFIRITFERG